MKVLIIARGVPTQKAPLNGIFEWDQALALAAQGVEVAYMALDFRKITHSRSWGIRCYQKEGIPVFEMSLPTGVYRRGLPLLQAACMYLYKKVKKQWGEPHMLHTHFYFMGAIAAKLAKRTHLTHVHTEHSSKLNKPLSAISHLDKKLAQMAFKSADKVIAVSSCYAQMLAANFGVKSVVIPNVLHLPVQVKNLHTAQDFTWVSVGRLIPSKGMLLLLNVFKELLQTHPHARLWIIGDGPQRSALTHFVRRNGLQNNVTLWGGLSRSQVHWKLSQAQAFVLLSQTETFGLSYVEAIAQGLPVVATQCGGPADFVDSTNGVLVPVGNPQAALLAMQHIMNNKQKYLSDVMSQAVKEQFGEERIAECLIQLYNAEYYHDFTID